MPRTMLSGTLEEQCAFLMDLSQQKIKAGNYTGAVHALKEIRKYAPHYPGLAEQMAKAQAGRREQRTLLLFGFGGAIVAVFLGTWLGVPNDLWFLGVALVGAGAGYLLGVAIGRRGRESGGPAGPAS